jgi:hypothetical protein
MTNGLRAVLSAVAFALVAGCAHSIKVTPDITRLEPVSPRVGANVGYYIPRELSSVEITTQGGGGDKAL